MTVLAFPRSTSGQLAIIHLTFREKLAACPTKTRRRLPRSASFQLVSPPRHKLEACATANLP